MIKREKGFSLIELLVTIAIMAILATIGLVSYNNALRTARDGKRRADLRDIQNGLEQYFTVCGNAYPTIPVAAAEGAPTIAVNPIICSSLDPTVNLLPTYPQDPKTKAFYYCKDTCSSSVYKICSTLEIDKSEYCVQSKQ